jgi:hypothetical protein
MSASSQQTVQSHFAARSANVKATYNALLRAVRAFGPVEQQPKKTSIHLARRTAFAGVATQREAILLTVKSPVDIRNARIRKHERASANRWHLELKPSHPDDVDAQLIDWLRSAYDMSA